MKRKLSMILALIITWGFCFSPVTAGQEKPQATSESVTAKEDVKAAFGNEEIEKLIRMIKSKIDIPESYTQFSSNIMMDRSYEGSVEFWFRWATDSYMTGRGGSIEVNIDRYGVIKSYSHYKYDRSYDYYRRLPSITKEKAASLVRKFCYMICPEIVSQLDFNDYDNCVIESNGNYTFTFFRNYKGIPFPQNYITVQVDGKTGEILYFYRLWTDNAIFPDPAAAMKEDDAIAKYKDELDLKLKYRKLTDDSKTGTYLVYCPGDADFLFGIDAVTGDRIFDSNRYNIYYEILYRTDMYLRSAASTDKTMDISEKELDELRSMEGLVSAEEAEKFLRDIDEIGISEEHVLNSFRYQTDNNAGYRLWMTFIRYLSKVDFGTGIPDEKLKLMIAAGEGVDTVEVVLDAKTKEIMEINSYGYYGEAKEDKKLERGEMQRIAENFLRKYKPEKLSQLKLVENAQTTSEPYIVKYPLVYSASPDSLLYIRHFNGIPFEDNGVALRIDPSTGRVTSYEEVWDEVEFISPSGVISADKAFEALLESNKPELKYVTVQPDEYEMTYGQSQGMSGIKLVYAPDFSKPLCVDAFSGSLINYYNNQPYKDKKSGYYSDISGHPSEERIKVLAEIEILPPEGFFRPDEPVVQKEYLYMITKLTGSYYYPIDGRSPFRQEVLDGMYRALINEGIIDEAEKDPDAKVTREEAVTYLLRAVGYRHFAELEGIFACDFRDKDEINPKLIGYVAIARSLKLVAGTGGRFMPKHEISRAEAADIIYNYLTR